MKKTLCFIHLLAGIMLCPAQQIVKDTYLYSVKGTDSLYLDKYTSESLLEAGDSPCIVFMFGGGFFTGKRDGQFYIPYFQFLVENGYTVVSIDYRLGLKPVASGEISFDTKKGPLGKIKLAKQFLEVFHDAVTIAVEDLFDATAFILGNSDEWGLDPGMLIANGSSAGAVSILQGQHAICNGEQIASRLPAGFNYAGLVSFAGAVFVEARDISFRSAPCPIMMFHGDADSNVPYDKIKKFGMGFFGSKYISAKLDAINAPHIFYSVAGADHSIAASPMNDNREDILSFLDKFVHKRERLIIDSDVRQADVRGRKKKFKIADYVKSNFGGGQ